MSNLHHTVTAGPPRGWTLCLPSNLLRMAVPAAKRWRAVGQ